MKYNMLCYRGNEEGDPAHGDEHGGGEVDAEDVGSDGPGQLYLEAVHAVVAWRERSCSV